MSSGKREIKEEMGSMKAEAFCFVICQGPGLDFAFVGKCARGTVTSRREQVVTTSPAFLQPGGG